MTRVIISVALTLLFIARLPATLAKPWRGITPLRSTAQDVAKFSRACLETETRCQFTLEEQEVMVIFSGSKIGLAECNRVPKLTVLAVIITFNSPKKLKDFQLKGQPFKLIDPSSPPKHGYKTFYYIKEGFM